MLESREVAQEGQGPDGEQRQQRDGPRALDAESCLRRCPCEGQPRPRDGVDAASQLYVSAAPPATPTIIRSMIHDVCLPNAALQSSENVRAS